MKRLFFLLAAMLTVGSNAFAMMYDGPDCSGGEGTVKITGVTKWGDREAVEGFIDGVQRSRHGVFRFSIDHAQNKAAIEFMMKAELAKDKVCVNITYGEKLKGTDMVNYVGNK